MDVDQKGVATVKTNEIVQVDENSGHHIAMDQLTISNLKEIVNTLQTELANAVSTINSKLVSDISAAKNEMSTIKSRLRQCENKDLTQDTSLNTLKTELTNEISTVKNEFTVSLMYSILTKIFLFFNNLHNL